MGRWRGVRAGEDTGSTTGVATAVLALLSAGMLAAFGVVTAGELRDLGPGPQGSQAGVLDPPDITFSPPPVETGGGGGPTGRGPSGLGPVVGVGVVTSPSAPVLPTAGPAAPTPTVTTPAPTVTTPAPTVTTPPGVPPAAVATPAPPATENPPGPALTDPPPVVTPQLAAGRHGRALGHEHSKGWNKKHGADQPAVSTATATVSAVSDSPSGVGPSAAPGSTTPATPTCRPARPGRSGGDRATATPRATKPANATDGRRSGAAPAPVVLVTPVATPTPLVPALPLAPPAGAPAPDDGNGQSQGRGNGQSQGHGNGQQPGHGTS